MKVKSEDKYEEREEEGKTRGGGEERGGRRGEGGESGEKEGKVRGGGGLGRNKWSTITLLLIMVKI